MEEIGATIRKSVQPAFPYDPSFHHKKVVFFFLSFSSYTFRGLAGAYVNPRTNSHFVHSLVCLNNTVCNSIISAWISVKFVSALLSCMLHLSHYFQSEVST